MDKNTASITRKDPQSLDGVDTSLRYKIYVRKSSEDSEKQIRSLDDQERECRDLAERLGLHVIGETIREEKSAKTPRRRPLFAALMKEVESGAIDGIISWHPDRLARNSVESGKIMYLLDTDRLHDLRFVSHQFSNDANGKMLLGMLFVFAKHYSDDLSSKVKRGVKGNFGEGKSGGVQKHGYIRDDEGFYRKDGKYFNMTQQAWSMRAEGIGLSEIADYLNKNKYAKYYKRDKGYRIMNVTPSTLSKMFLDPFYYGILVQAEQTVDLRSLPIPFEPMITEEQYHTVQENNKSKRRGAGKKKQFFLAFRELMFCAVCNDPRSMIVSRSKGAGGKYYTYFRCRNKECSRKPRDIRGSVIAGATETAVEHAISRLSEDAYKTYLNETKELSQSEKKAVRGDIVRLQAELKHLQTKEQELTSAIAKVDDEKIIQKYSIQLSENNTNITKAEQSIERLEKRLKQTEVSVVSPKGFAELIETAVQRFKNGSPVQKDIILRNLFLNIYFDKEKVVHYTLREPFDTLVRTTDFLLAEEGRFELPLQVSPD